MISVIIPMGPREPVPHDLLRELSESTIPIEIILATGAREYDGYRCVRSAWGRAAQMNAGASAALYEFLWFLHADSRLNRETFEGARAAFATRFAVHFFRLRFLGSWLMHLNEWGVRFRSEFLKMPFGDQGLLMDRETFNRMGGFDSSVTYGEDHLFVWRARRMGIPVRCTGAVLLTSARKYEEVGWLKVTSRHLFLTWRQAIPEVVKWIRG